jgi:hypothetical protein
MTATNIHYQQGKHEEESSPVVSLRTNLFEEHVASSIENMTSLGPSPKTMSQRPINDSFNASTDNKKMILWVSVMCRYTIFQRLSVNSVD